MSVEEYVLPALLVSVTLAVLIGVLTVLFITFSCSSNMASTSGITMDRENLYVSCLQSFLSKGSLSPRTNPSQVLDFLYVGGANDAYDATRLKDLGITHVINCASSYIRTGHGQYGPQMRYLEFDAEDELDYDIMSHFDSVFQFIEEARNSGGKAFVHCIMGINRSVALVAAYVMTYEGIGPISAVKRVVNARCSVLTNVSFQRQLIQFAAQRNLLELDKHELTDYNSNI